MNAQPGRPAAYPTKGFFKHEDMIRLEKLKKEIFTDYGRVEKYIEYLLYTAFLAEKRLI